jgi:hypothetical protein
MRGEDSTIWDFLHEAFHRPMIGLVLGLVAGAFAGLFWYLDRTSETNPTDGSIPHSQMLGWLAIGFAVFAGILLLMSLGGHLYDRLSSRW